MPTLLEATEDQKRLLEAVESQLQDLPPLPAVIVRVMQTVNEPKTSADDLNRLISSDQALSGKILRLVNSSYYGYPKRISTITHAIVILGLNTIRNLATSLGVAKAFDSGKSSALDADQFWAHSVGTAACAWTIARARGLSAKLTEEAFVGGLLHDMGKQFLNQCFASQYGAVMELASTGYISMRDAERSVLGIDHTVIGKRVAEKWNLPATIIAMVAGHHDPSNLDEHFDLVATIHTADMLARKLAFGNGGNSTDPQLDPIVEKWLTFTPPMWEQIEAAATRKNEAAMEFMKITRD